MVRPFELFELSLHPDADTRQSRGNFFRIPSAAESQVRRPTPACPQLAGKVPNQVTRLDTLFDQVLGHRCHNNHLSGAEGGDHTNTVVGIFFPEGICQLTKGFLIQPGQFHCNQVHAFES